MIFEYLRTLGVFILVTFKLWIKPNKENITIKDVLVKRQISLRQEAHKNLILHSLSDNRLYLGILSLLLLPELVVRQQLGCLD